MASLTLLFHLFTLFANYDRVALEISCFVYRIDIYFDIYDLFVSENANNIINKYTHKKCSKISQHQKECHSENLHFFEWVASHFLATFAISKIFSSKSVLFWKQRSICVLTNSSPKSFLIILSKIQTVELFYVHLQTFLLVFQKAVQSSYSAKNLSVELVISIKGI